MKIKLLILVLILLIIACVKSYANFGLAEFGDCGFGESCSSSSSGGGGGSTSVAGGLTFLGVQLQFNGSNLAFNP